MPAKDFYKILDVPLTASQHEIKTAYRQLALKYHPDVNAGGKATENWFREIHDAYRVLANPEKRSAYNQERWYRESTVSGNSEPPLTPEALYLKCCRLVTQTRSLDRDRTNFLALQRYLLYILNDENLLMLEQWNNQQVNIQIADEIMAASEALGYKKFLPVAKRMEKLFPAESPALTQALKIKRRTSWWKNFQLPIVVLAAILLCLLLYLAGR
ncbi:MAG: DnaJ domain-containing protein [Chitinophagaceae bacterium]